MSRIISASDLETVRRQIAMELGATATEDDARLYLESTGYQLQPEGANRLSVPAPQRSADHAEHLPSASGSRV